MWPLWLQLFSYELLFWGRGQKLYMQENAFFETFFFFSEEDRSMKEKCMFALHNAVNAINMACRNMACRTIFCMLYWIQCFLIFLTSSHSLSQLTSSWKGLPIEIRCCQQRCNWPLILMPPPPPSLASVGDAPLLRQTLHVLMLTNAVAAVVVSYDYLPGAETLMAQKFTANIQSMNGFTNEYGGNSRSFNSQGNFFLLFSPLAIHKKKMLSQWSSQRNFFFLDWRYKRLRLYQYFVLIWVFWCICYLRHGTA